MQALPLLDLKRVELEPDDWEIVYCQWLSGCRILFNSPIQQKTFNNNAGEAYTFFVLPAQSENEQPILLFKVLRIETEARVLRVCFNPYTLYVQGFQVDQTWFLFEEADIQRLGQPEENIVRIRNLKGNYPEFAPRDTIGLGREQIINAVNCLASGDWGVVGDFANTVNGNMRNSMVVLFQMLSEAIRFPFIENVLVKMVYVSTRYVLTTPWQTVENVERINEIWLMENQWDANSTTILKFFSCPLPLDKIELRWLEMFARRIKVLKWSSFDEEGGGGRGGGRGGA